MLAALVGACDGQIGSRVGFDGLSEAGTDDDAGSAAWPAQNADAKTGNEAMPTDPKPDPGGDPRATDPVRTRTLPMDTVTDKLPGARDGGPVGSRDAGSCDAGSYDAGSYDSDSGPTDSGGGLGTDGALDPTDAGDAAAGGTERDGGSAPDGGPIADPGDTRDAGDSTDGGQASDAGNSTDGPCPTDGQPCRILPFGNSITYGVGAPGDGGYRTELFRRALDDAKNITFVGGEVHGPAFVDGVPFPRNHEGHPGWRIADLAGRVPTPALDERPDIILLMAGTNDMFDPDRDAAPERMDDMLGTIVVFAPEALVVVAQLTPLEEADEAVQLYNTALAAVVQARVQAGQRVLLADMHTGFSLAMLWDGIHPNASGYARVADVWYAAIRDFLP